MRCDDVREELELFVLGGLPAEAEARMAAHLADCPRCRAAEEDCRRLVSEARRRDGGAGPRPAFARGLRAAVAGAIAVERRRTRVRRVVAAVCSAAAAVLIAVVLWRAWPGTGPASPTGPTRATDPTDPTDPTDVPPGESAPSWERWRFAQAETSPASPADAVVVRDGSIYLLRSGRAGSAVVAVDTATGAMRWESACRSRGCLAADEGRVYSLAAGGSRRLELVALDAADGAEQWRVAHDGPPSLHSPCAPLPLSGGRVCWTAGRTVHLLDAATGAAVWTHAVMGEGLPSCAVAEGDALYVVTGKALHCLAAASGAASWREELPEAARGVGRPLSALAGGRLFVAQTRVGRGSQLCCVDLGSRRLLWRRRVPGVRSLLATDEAVYVRGQEIVALSHRTGERLWRRAAEGCGPLTRSGGLVHFVDTRAEGRLVALSERSGQTAWEIPGIRSCDGFTKVGDTGYIKTQDGIVHALAFCGRPRL